MIDIKATTKELWHKYAGELGHSVVACVRTTGHYCARTNSVLPSPAGIGPYHNLNETVWTTYFTWIDGTRLLSAVAIIATLLWKDVTHYNSTRHPWRNHTSRSTTHSESFDSWNSKKYIPIYILTHKHLHVSMYAYRNEYQSWSFTIKYG